MLATVGQRLRAATDGAIVIIVLLILAVGEHGLMIVVVIVHAVVVGIRGVAVSRVFVGLAVEVGLHANALFLSSARQKISEVIIYIFGSWQILSLFYHLHFYSTHNYYYTSIQR